MAGSVGGVRKEERLSVYDESWSRAGEALPGNALACAVVIFFSYRGDYPGGDGDVMELAFGSSRATDVINFSPLCVRDGYAVCS